MEHGLDLPVSMQRGLKQAAVDLDQPGVLLQKAQRSLHRDQKHLRFGKGLDAAGGRGLEVKGGHGGGAQVKAEAVGDVPAVDVQKKAAQDAGEQERNVGLRLALPHQKFAPGYPARLRHSTQLADQFRVGDMKYVGIKVRNLQGASPL